MRKTYLVSLQFYRKECLIHGIFGLRCLRLDCHFLGGYHEAWCEIVKPLRKFWTVGDYRLQVHKCINKFLSLQWFSCLIGTIGLSLWPWKKTHLHPSYFHFSPRCSVVTNCRTFYGYILGHQIWGWTFKRRSRKVSESHRDIRQLKHLHGYTVFCLRRQLGTVYKNPWNQFTSYESSENDWKKSKLIKGASMRSGVCDVTWPRSSVVPWRIVFFLWPASQWKSSRQSQLANWVFCWFHPPLGSPLSTFIVGPSEIPTFTPKAAAARANTAAGAGKPEGAMPPAGLRPVSRPFSDGLDGWGLGATYYPSSEHGWLENHLSFHRRLRYIFNPGSISSQLCYSTRATKCQMSWLKCST